MVFGDTDVTPLFYTNIGKFLEAASIKTAFTDL